MLAKTTDSNEAHLVAANTPERLSGRDPHCSGRGGSTPPAMAPPKTTWSPPFRSLAAAGREGSRATAWAPPSAYSRRPTMRPSPLPPENLRLKCFRCVAQQPALLRRSSVLLGCRCNTALRRRGCQIDSAPVPETRLELVSPYGRRILSPLRIPFRHSGGRNEAASIPKAGGSVQNAAGAEFSLLRSLRVRMIAAWAGSSRGSSKLLREHGPGSGGRSASYARPAMRRTSVRFSLRSGMRLAGFGGALERRFCFALSQSGAVPLGERRSSSCRCRSAAACQVRVAGREEVDRTVHCGDTRVERLVRGDYVASRA